MANAISHNAGRCFHCFHAANAAQAANIPKRAPVASWKSWRVTRQKVRMVTTMARQSAGSMFAGMSEFYYSEAQKGQLCHVERGRERPAGLGAAAP